MRQLTRVELDKMKKLYGFEEVGQEALTSFVKDIEKGITSAEFTKEEIGDFANTEINSYTPIQVIEPDLSKTIRFIRHQQVRWGNPDDIVKSIADKDGIYLDTDRNQKLGLVGMPYDFDIIKAKKANIGEIRYYSGIPYRKVTSTGNSNKDWQRVKDMAKNPGAKGGEKHEEKVDMPEGFKIGDIVESKNDADIPTSVRDVLGKVVGSVKGTTSVPLYLKVDTGTTVHEVNPNYMMKQSGDNEKEMADEGSFKIGEKVRFKDNYGELIEGVITKIEGDMVHSKQINSPNSFIRNKKDVVRLKQAESKPAPTTPEKKEEPKTTDKSESTSKKEESGEIKQKFIPKAKEKFEKFLKEENYWKKRLDEIKIKPFQKVDHYRKKMINEAYRKIELAQKNQQRTLYGHDILKSAFKQLEVSASVETSTAIKGFTKSSTGYSFSDYDQHYVDFTGISSGRLSTIVDAVTKLGFEITKVEQPSKVISGGSGSSISFKPYFNESDLTS